MRKIDIHEMIERDTAEAAMPTNPTDDVIERAEGVVMRCCGFGEKACVACKAIADTLDYLRTARADTRRLREAIENAKRTAGNRWCEWGDRAEAVAMILDAAIAAEEG